VQFVLFVVFMWRCLSFLSCYDVCSVQIIKSGSIQCIFNQWLWSHQR